jgi:hypothetical protein
LIVEGAGGVFAETFRRSFETFAVEPQTHSLSSVA